MQFRAVKGMNDILPGEVQRWQRLEAAFRRIVGLHGYEELRTPLLETTSLFTRSIGETTDVVQKEMYTFDRGKESLSLRPEGTASAARAYVQHAVHSKEPVTRWYYIGPMFRAERPQRGRYRQFHQAGCELYGDPGPACDAEMIKMLCDLLTELKCGELDVRVSSLGGSGTRERYRQTLLDYLRPRRAELSELSRERLEANPLRVLDSKAPQDQALVADAPSVLAALDDEDRRHFEQLKAHLDALGVPYRVDASLVRGLDYYTRTLFEICSNAGELGAQNALLGGGRYDGMVKSFGGPEIPAIGFAMGLERILLAMEHPEEAAAPFCFLAPIGVEAQKAALVLAREIRQLGQRAEVDGRGNSVKSMLRRADSTGARLCVVLGEAELAAAQIEVKDLRDKSAGNQKLPLAEAARSIAERLALAHDPESALP